MKKHPTKEELEEYFIIENHSIKETRKYFNLGTKLLYKLFKEYGLQKTMEQKVAKVKQTVLERYGVDSVAHIEGAIEKRKQTCLEKYGSISPFGSKEVQEKAKLTFQSKYGCHPRSTIEVQDKCKQTCLEKYGVDNVSKSKEVKDKIAEALKIANQNPEVKKKREQTNKEKYGVNYFTQNHLSERTLDILKSKENFLNYLQSLPDILRNKKHIAADLGVHTTNIGPKLHEWELDTLINYNPLYSAGQVEIMQILDSWDIKYVANDRQVISPREIDIYIPSKQIGIEFNGNYWHQEENKGKDYHLVKSKIAKENNIFIYHTFEYDWRIDSNKSRIINQLKNLLGLNEYKIFARKCEIKEVSTKEAKIFLEENHLQGNDKALVKLGLYFNNELVAIMTFCKPRFNRKFEWELSRFCCKANTTIVGGASKLFKYFIKNYNPQNIISYSDIAHTRGNLYEKLGFKLDHISKPNYVWCKREKFLTRYECQKHKLIQKFPEYKDLSETEIMTKLGWFKVYDCGNKVWIYNIEREN